MFLRKAQGNCSIAEYEWPHDDSVVEVPDWLGMELLAIPRNDFTEVRPAHTLAAAEPTQDEVPPEDVDSDVVPEGTAPQVLAWVGEDPERAQRALEVERGKGVFEARSTLMQKLEKIL
jgi:hypothetical protein